MIETPMTSEHLVLFDIDGTLLTTNGHGVEAMMQAYTAVWDRDPRQVTYAMSGKTERQISFELLERLGFSRHEVEPRLATWFEQYPQALERCIAPETTRVFPGVRELVKQVAKEEDMVLGLLTGNCEAAADIKLATAGLDGFLVGAFGEHHERRAELVPLALEHAQTLLGQTFEGRAVVVIGDTPNDIHCGKASGAKTIAVATGGFDAEALAAHDPDFVFEDFSDLDAVMDALHA